MPKISSIQVVSPVPSGAYWTITDPTDNNKTKSISSDDILNAGGGRVLIHTPTETTNTIQDDALIGIQSIYKIEAANSIFTDPENDADSFPGYNLDTETGTLTISEDYFYANTKFIIYIIP